MGWKVARCCAPLAAIAISLSGCIAHNPLDDLFDAFACHGPDCPVRPEVQIRILAPLISADANEVTVPFLCKPLNGRAQELRAISYRPDTNGWRGGKLEGDIAQQVEDTVKPAKGDQVRAAMQADPFEGPRSCASDCRRYVWIGRVDTAQGKPHPELLYSNDGVVQQLTYFNMPGGPLAFARLSDNGQRAVLIAAGRLAVVEVPSGRTSAFQVYPRAFENCSSG